MFDVNGNNMHAISIDISVYFISQLYLPFLLDSLHEALPNRA